MRMRKKRELLLRRQFVIEGNQHAAHMENRVRGNQPLRLIRHDDGGAVAGAESALLQRSSERQRGFFELAIGEAILLALAVGFD